MIGSSVNFRRQRDALLELRGLVLDRAPGGQEELIAVGPGVNIGCRVGVASEPGLGDRDWLAWLVGDRALTLRATGTESPSPSHLMIAMHRLVVFVPKVSYASIHQQPFPGWKVLFRNRESVTRVV